jgi:hypothetical protein
VPGHGDGCCATAKREQAEQDQRLEQPRVAAAG